MQRLDATTRCND